MIHFYTEDPVATLYDAVLKVGFSELKGITLPLVSLTFDSKIRLVDSFDEGRAEEMLDWYLDSKDDLSRDWFSTLVNLRTPGKEKVPFLRFAGVTYQILHLGTHLDLTANIHSIDLSGSTMLPIAQHLLKRAAKFAEVDPGEITALIGWVHLPWELVVENGDVEERLVEY